jgi:hypothetical protein
MNIARLTELDDAGLDGLARYATAGRLLADLPSATGDVAAREALVGLLGTWTSRLETPRLGDLGYDASDIDRVLAGVSTGSMSTNPVVLSPDDLATILDTSA